MIIIRRKHRSRFTETVLSLGLIGFGAISLFIDYNNSAYYSWLLNLAPQMIWSLAALALGSLRLIIASLDGLCANMSLVYLTAFSSLIWGSLLTVAFLQNPLTINIFAMILALEFFNIWNASGDSKNKNDRI